MRHETGSLLWGLSAADAGALRAQAALMHDRLGADQDWRPEDVGWSLARTGAVAGGRAAVVAADRAGFLESLRALADGRGAPGLVEGRPGDGRVVFAFPGNGSK